VPDTSHDPETRVENYTRESNLVWVTNALVEQREEILSHWLEAAEAQPFFRGRREYAVADHIPQLFDALVEFLQHATPRGEDPSPPLDNTAIRAAAQGHALARSNQGLQPPDVLAEFRLLRQELWHALRLALPEDALSSDVVGAELVLNDALDGAAALALSALTAQIEEQREEFLANVVHEVRQPVTNIKGCIQLAQRLLNCPSPDLPRALTSLEHGEQSTERMNSALNALVDASRTALGGFALRPESADLTAIIHSAAEQLGTDVAERVTLDILPGLDTINRWDIAGLTQVFSNLLSNAAKYSPPRTPIKITMEDDDDTILIGVHDEGIGIPADDLPRLFRRYVRGRNALAQSVEGLGLGLYLSRGIVEAHGGHMWATSPGVGQGTTIFVSLPRQMVAAAED
jgi:signal transduction histidine kinase